MQPFLNILFLLSVSLAHAQGLPGDIDGDGLLDIDEDRNQNGITDPGETDPYDADTDGGGEGDGKELEIGHDPLDPSDDFTFDRDGDGLANGEEITLGTDPDIPDTDGDGVQDGSDAFPLEEEYSTDTDNDGLPDEYEQQYSNPGNSGGGNGGGNTSGSTTGLHPDDDNDNDSLSNLNEYKSGTNPLQSDTDRDGALDGQEIASGTKPTESPCIVYAEPNANFYDTQEHWAQAIVETMHRIKVQPELIRIVRGYGDSMEREFRPNQNISRFEFMKIALLTTCIALDPDDANPKKTFTDFSFRTEEGEHPDMAFRRRVLTTALRYDIIEGYEDGTLRPDAPINRAEALKILLLSSGIHPNKEQQEANPLTFTDVWESHWFATYVRDGTALTIIEGYPDKTFRPGQPITRAETAKIALYLMMMNPRVNGYVIPKDGL